MESVLVTCRGVVSHEAGELPPLSIQYTRVGRGSTEGLPEGCGPWNNYTTPIKVTPYLSDLILVM